MEGTAWAMSRWCERTYIQGIEPSQRSLEW